MGFGEAADDGEAEAGAAGGAVAGGVGSIEAIEHVRQVLGGNAAAGVGDVDPQPAAFAAGANVDAPILRACGAARC